MKKRFTYAVTGVDRDKRAKSKKALSILDSTYKLSRYGEIVRLPYGNIFPIGSDLYFDLVIEGVGSKVLVAQLMDKYDTIGVDAVAMAVNDVIRSGARPIAVADNIHAEVSDPELISEWLKGIAKGATEAECIVPSGEIGDVPEVVRSLVEGKGFDMVVASVGEVHREKIIFGNTLKPGDAVIGLRSSGIHSNGVSLARRILFKKWGGKYEPNENPETLNREVGLEFLEPTRIYVKPLLNLAQNCEIKAAVHITGDAYMKFNKLMALNAGIGFEFDNFKPQPIFELIAETAKQIGGAILVEEMFKTFNMGWGFAVVVDHHKTDDVLDVLERNRAEPEQIGIVTSSNKITVTHVGEKILLWQSS